MSTDILKVLPYQRHQLQRHRYLGLDLEYHWTRFLTWKKCDSQSGSKLSGKCIQFQHVTALAEQLSFYLSYYTCACVFKYNQTSTKKRAPNMSSSSPWQQISHSLVPMDTHNRVSLFHLFDRLASDSDCPISPIILYHFKVCHWTVFYPFLTILRCFHIGVCVGSFGRSTTSTTIPVRANNRQIDHIPNANRMAANTRVFVAHTPLTHFMRTHFWHNFQSKSSKSISPHVLETLIFQWNFIHINHSLKLVKYAERTLRRSCRWRVLIECCRRVVRCSLTTPRHWTTRWLLSAPSMWRRACSDEVKCLVCMCVCVCVQLIVSCMFVFSCAWFSAATIDKYPTLINCK
jgi:hypothetical protein